MAGETDNASKDVSPLSVTIKSFRTSMDALNDLATSLETNVDELDQPYHFLGAALQCNLPPDPSDVSALSNPPPKIARVGLKFTAALTCHVLTEWFPEGEDAGKVREMAEAIPDLNEAFNELVDFFEGDVARAQAFGDRVGRVVIARKSRGEIFRRSLVVAGVGALERLVASVMHELYLRFPAALGKDEPALSLTELRDFHSIDDAIREAVSRRTESDMRLGLDEWAHNIGRRNGIDLPAVVPGWKDVREVYERRNLLVHHDGCISRQYLEKVGPDSGSSRVGVQLWTTKDYTRHALDRILAAGTLIAVEVWHAIDKHGRAALDRDLQELTYQLMLEGRWMVVRPLCERAIEFATSEASRMVARCNLWLAVKRTDGFDAIRGEVEKWDTSALSQEFNAVKLALLGCDDDALDAVATAVSSGRLSRRLAEEWPVLEELRQRNDWVERLPQISPSEVRSGAELVDEIVDEAGGSSA